MPQNIKITPGIGLLEFIGNTLNTNATDFKLSVDATGKVSVLTSPLVNAFITGLGIDPAVLLGTANEIQMTPGGVNGQMTVSLPSTVIFPGIAQVSTAPVGPNDLANKAYVDANAGKKLTVRATANTNIAIATAPSTVDGVNLVSDDLVLLTGQADNTQNGVYVFNGAGNAMTRYSGFNTWSQVVGALITVSQGSSFANTLWMSTSALTGTVGSTAITFKRVDLASGVPGNAGVVHTDGTVFTASPIVDADVANVSWNKITNVPSSIGSSTLQTTTQNGNTTNQNIVLLATGVPPAPASGGALYVDNTGAFGWVNSSGFSKLFSGTVTASRTYTLPDASGTVVLTTGIQTVDRKTLTNTIVNTGTDATGDMYYRDASGFLTAIALGSLGMVMGAGPTGPVWGNPSVDWSNVTNTPTSLLGYNINDPVLLRTGGTMTGSLFLAGDPLSPTMAATKNYVDMRANGLAWKNSVRASTAGTALPANTADGTFQTLTANSNGVLPAIDGVTLVAGDTLLVMDEADQTSNGAYTVTNTGSVGSQWVLTREPDSNTGSLLVSATYYIREGSLFGNRIYTMNTVPPITLGTTNITFVQIAGPSTYTNGAGLDLIGNVFSISNGGVTNAMLANPSISLSITQNGLQPSWSTSSVALGGTATLNLPVASATVTGVLSAADWVLFNAKLSASNAFEQGGNTFAALAVLGTNDAFDISFIAHSIEAMRISQSNGYVLIGASAPVDQSKLQVTGSISVFGQTNTIPQLKLQKAVNQNFGTPTIMVADTGSNQLAGLYFDATNQIITGAPLTSGSSFTGSNDTSLGYGTLLRITTGISDTAVGFQALSSVTTGNWNTAIGSQALLSVTIGNYNVGIGGAAGNANISGVDNIFIGYQSGNTNTGSSNVMIGSGAGASNTGSGNVFIGFHAGAAAGTTGNISNKLYISNQDTATPLILGDFNGQLLTFNAYTSISGPTNTGSSNGSALTVQQTWNTTGAVTLIKANVTNAASGATSYLIQLSTNNAAMFAVDVNGNATAAGNGTFGGNIYLPKSTVTVGSIYKNGSLWISSYSGGPTQDNNMFVGYQTGNLTNTGAGLNVAVGYNSMPSVSSGSENVAVGPNALRALTTGVNNIAVGSSSLTKLTNGNNNIAIGQGVLSLAMVSGGNNVIIGTQAGLNSTGSGNVFIGHNAGQNELGSNLLYIANSFISNPLIWGDFFNQIMRVNGQLQVIGTNDVDSIFVQTPVVKTLATTLVKIVDSSSVELFRLNANTTNLFMGNQSGSSALTGTSNLGVGPFTLQSVTGGASNIAIGLNALKVLTTGSSNTLVGVIAGANISTGGANTGIGQSALGSLTTGGSNTAVGMQALSSATVGTNNVAIGFSTGLNNNGSGNVFIGYQAGASASPNAASNQLFISNSNTTTPLVFGDFSNTYLTFNGAVNIAAPTFTGSNANLTSALHIAQTWNTSGTPALIYATVSDTASNAGSLLLALLTNSVNMLTVDKTGTLFVANQITAPGMTAPGVGATTQFVVWDTVTKQFHVSATGGGGGTGFTSAINGLSSPATGVVQLGQPNAGTTGPAILTGNTYIPLGGYSLTLESTNANELISVAANYIMMQAQNNSNIKLDIRTGSVITMVDEATGAPTILMSSNFALGAGTVQIQNNQSSNIFQIVEVTKASGFVYNTSTFNFGIKTLNPLHDFTVNGVFGVTQATTNTNAFGAVDIQNTWNTTSNITSVAINVTKTAAGSGSVILNVSQDGLTKLYIPVDSASAVFSSQGMQLQGNGGSIGGISLNSQAVVSNRMNVSAGFVLQCTDVDTSGNTQIAIGANNTSNASGTGRLLAIGSQFTPISGNGVFNMLELNPVINQTGTATGISRGLYINPTLTSAIDFRAIEVVAGSVRFATLALAPKVLAGAQQIDTTATNWLFNDITPQTWTLPGANVPTGTMLFVKNRSAVNLTVVPQSGMQIFDLSPITTLTIAPGDAYIFVYDGQYWSAE